MFVQYAVGSGDRNNYKIHSVLRLNNTEAMDPKIPLYCVLFFISTQAVHISGKPNFVITQQLFIDTYWREKIETGMVLNNIVPYIDT